MWHWDCNPVFGQLQIAQCSCFLYFCINKPTLIIFNIVFSIFIWHLGPKIGNVWTKQALQAYLIFWLWQKHHLKPKPFCPGWTDLRLGFNLQNKLYLHFRLRCCLSCKCSSRKLRSLRKYIFTKTKTKVTRPVKRKLRCRRKNTL